MTICLTINGASRRVASDPMTPLGEVLREEFCLTGTKLVCSEGFCGACAVWLDGRLVLSCLTPVGAADGSSVETIEGAAGPADIKARLQKAFEEHDVVQCGMCFPGMVMSLSAYLGQAVRPTREDLRAALVGNICRCTGYERIIDAALSIVGEG